MIRSGATFAWQKKELDSLVLKIDPFYVLIVVLDMMQPFHRVIFLDQAEIPSLVKRPKHSDPLFYDAEWIKIMRIDFIKMTPWTPLTEWLFTLTLP